MTRDSRPCVRALRDEQALLALFAPDATWTADGGGKTAAAPLPIVGADRIARLVLGLREKFWAKDRTLEVATVNGETGRRIRDGGRTTGVMSIVTDGTRILAVYAVVNPDSSSSLLCPLPAAPRLRRWRLSMTDVTSETARTSSL